MLQQTKITFILITLNVLIFVLAHELRLPLFNNWKLYFIENPAFASWQLLTHMFMHGSWMHLLFNMFGVAMFGLWLERVWGARRFLVFYLITGIGAAIIYTAINTFKFDQTIAALVTQGVQKDVLLGVIAQGRYFPNISDTATLAELFNTPVVGASGAVYGVLVAYAWYFPNHKIALIFLPIPVAAKFFVPALIALDLLSGVTGFSIFGGNIAHFAHVGGALVGFLLVALWLRPKRLL